MEAKIKPIPAFYCCYLLRSSIRHTSLYVGSTPHPSRRLAQHNGQSKGGAVRTSRLSLQPWEMTCIVNGFPSNIAALQFEWAWQNAHLSRHILPDERISFPVTLIRTNRKTGKTRKKPGRPRTSMVERLSNLHLLLRTRYFSQWPLELRFFSEDVYRRWQSWCNRVDTQIRPEINIVLDPLQTSNEEPEFTSAQRPQKKRKIDLIGKGGVEGVDPTYARYQDVLEKHQFLDPDDQHTCNICKDILDTENELYSICAYTRCTSLSHITCLSQRALQDTTDCEIVLPTTSKCPECGIESAWSDVVRSVSLRMRGEKEVKKLLKKKRGTKTATAAEILEDEDEDDEDEDLDDTLTMVDEDADNDDDRMSVSSFGSVATDTRSPVKKIKDSTRLEIVIEDSEDER